MHGAATLPVALALAIASFRKSDLVYINTITVINYLLVARLFRSKTLLHVHEAPVGVLGKMYAALVRRICVPTIYNSEATRRAYEITERALTFVLYNGIRGPTTSTACSYNGARRLRLLMIGRLSRQKGQDILIEACGLLSPTALRSIEIAIVGSSFELQIKLEKALLAQARRIAGLETLRFEPFVNDPTFLYNWCDLAVIPSRTPEGLGRVAVEAMAHGRGCIVASHGGITEVVRHGETGWHVTPGDPHALADAIRLATADFDSVRAFGKAARARFERLFTIDAVDAQLRGILRQCIP